LNEELRRELLAMQAEDLRVRELLIAREELSRGYHPEMEAVHKRNSARLREIVDEVGWPGASWWGTTEHRRRG